MTFGIDRSRLKAIVGGSAGNLVEWYDWYAYSVLSIYFAPVFFPDGDATAQLLNTAAIFAVGFLMRPIGAWIMGIYADRHGRKSGLALSVGLMCAGSLLIAIAPGYATIGVVAPLLLVIARMLQGLSVGGEYGASATYLSEMATRTSRGFWSSFQYVTLIAGQLAALVTVLILQFLLSEEALESWGWRIPFVIGAILALVVYVLRSRLAETQSFTAQSPDRPASSARNLWRDHPREFILVAMITAGGSMSFYAYTTYMQKFLVNTAGLTRAESSLVSAATLFIFMCLQPLFGALSDRIGRRPLLLAFGVLGVALTVPLLDALGRAQSAAQAFWLILAALVIVSGYTSINAVVKAELFPVGIRALGVGLPYALAVSLFGGTAEYIALWFKSVGRESGYYWYVTGCIACSLAVYGAMRETRSTSRIDRDQGASMERMRS